MEKIQYRVMSARLKKDTIKKLDVNAAIRGESRSGLLQKILEKFLAENDMWQNSELSNKKTPTQSEGA